METSLLFLCGALMSCRPHAINKWDLENICDCRQWPDGWCAGWTATMHSDAQSPTRLPLSKPLVHRRPLSCACQHSCCVCEVEPWQSWLVLSPVAAFHLPSVSFARSGPRRSVFPVIRYSKGKFRAIWWKIVGTNFSEIWVDVEVYPLVEMNSSSVINPSSGVCRIVHICL